MNGHSKSKKISAIEYARAWAKQHPAFGGRVVVKLLLPAGRNGWKLKACSVTYFARGGKVTKKASHWTQLAGRERRHFENGCCECCGNTAVEACITTGWKDGRWLTACPLCLIANRFVLVDARPFRGTEAERATEFMRFDRHHSPEHVIDLTGGANGAPPIAQVNANVRERVQSLVAAHGVNA